MPSPEPSSSSTPVRVAPVVIDTVARLNARAWAVACGLVGGLGLLIATWVLVLEGGPVVGPHLALLGQYFPGYRVTFGGGLLGLVYGFVAGYAFGWIVGTVYNKLVPPTA